MRPNSESREKIFPTDVLFVMMLLMTAIILSEFSSVSFCLREIETYVITREDRK